MNVYISATPEVSPETLIGVHKILSSVHGEIEFIKGEGISEDFMKIVIPDFSSKEVLSEQELINVINHYKTKHDIFLDSYVLLLTDKEFNSTKPILFTDNVTKNYSIITITNWSVYSTYNPIYCIAYKCLEDFFINLDDRIKITSLFKVGNGHGSKIGCLGDHNRYTKNIHTNSYVCLNKMKVADICSRCVATLSVKYSFQFLTQICSLLEKIRESIVMSQWLKTQVKPNILSIDKKGLIKIGTKEFTLQNRLTALYILLLIHEEGVDTFSLSNHKEELHNIYKTLRGVKKEVKNSGLSKIIDNLCNIEVRDSKGKIISKDNKPFRDAVSEINKELMNQLGDPLCSFYQIELFRKSIDGNYYQTLLAKDLIDLDPIFR